MRYPQYKIYLGLFLPASMWHTDWNAGVRVRTDLHSGAFKFLSRSMSVCSQIRLFTKYLHVEKILFSILSGENFILSKCLKNMFSKELLKKMCGGMYGKILQRELSIDNLWMSPLLNKTGNNFFWKSWMENSICKKCQQWSYLFCLRQHSVAPVFFFIVQAILSTAMFKSRSCNITIKSVILLNWLEWINSKKSLQFLCSLFDNNLEFCSSEVWGILEVE